MFLFMGSIPAIFVHPVFLITLCVGIYNLLRGGLDITRTFGSVYWVSKKDTRLFSVGKGTMHQLSAPWKKGSGIYVAVAYRILQIGLCFRQNLDDIEGTLSAVQGRYLDVEPKEIGKW
jgi:hypothetical protein